MGTPLSQEVRALLLPIERTAHDSVMQALESYADTQGFTSDDLAIVLREDLDAWAQQGEVSSTLRSVIDVALKFTPDVLRAVNARSYLGMYTKLRARSNDVAGLTHAVARDLLSRAGLIGHLLKEERFSCTQVARLLASTDAALDVSHGSIAVIARALKLLPTLPSGPEYAALWQRDRNLSSDLFPDSTAEETIEIAAEVLQPWIREHPVADLLKSLCRSEASTVDPVWPYLQILHWCLTPLEYFDHPASYLYEFRPRGKSGDTLFANYPAVTGNPVLNNAKAIETLNRTWSRNRGGEDAHALVTLVQALEALPAVSRREAASVLRAWLWRIVDLRTTEPSSLDVDPTRELIETVVNSVSATETSTRGVIEQRVVDYLSYLAYALPDWRPRGLGDGVNASNFSRHKLGDVEFAKVDDRSAVAVEAHGGHLSRTYVRDHRRSLARIVKQRLDESWANLDDPSKWSIKVVFVSHSRDADLPLHETMHGVPVAYQYLQYPELVALAHKDTSELDQRDAFQIYVVDALNRRNVRESTRLRFQEIAVTSTPRD